MDHVPKDFAFYSPHLQHIDSYCVLTLSGWLRGVLMAAQNRTLTVSKTGTSELEKTINLLRNSRLGK